MKVYSWKTLIISIVAFTISMIISVSELINGDSLQILFIIMWIYLFIKGLGISFSRDAFNTDKLNGIIADKVMKRLFGKWRFIVQWGWVIIYCIALLIFRLFPNQTWITISIFIIAGIYSIVVGIYVRKEVNKEKKDYFL